MSTLRSAATILFVLQVLFALHASSALADSRLGAGCDLATIGVEDKAAFLRFDRDLKHAFSTGDAAAVALLAQFPLRLNLADGSHLSLADAATLQKQFDRIFPQAQRDAVRTEPLDDVFCRAADGIGYLDGYLWVGLAGAGGKQLRIVAVNVPGDESVQSKIAGETDLACSTKQIRIVIDKAGDTTARYRAWNLPHGIADKPDIELDGTRTVEGTSPCTHRLWRFDNKNASYRVSEPGCNPEMPQGALAEVRVLVDGTQRMHAWCF